MAVLREGREQGMRTRWVTAVLVSAMVALGLVGLSPGPALADRSINGKIAFASSADGDYDIYTMNEDGTDVQNLTDPFGPFDDTDPSWSPDGLRISFTSTRADTGGSDVFVMDENGANQVQLTDQAGENFGSDWSPEGARIAFTSTRAATGTSSS
jgi:Tol biopolymer transport system component